MGSLTPRSPLLTLAQLERIEELAQHLLEQTAARSVLVSVDGGATLAAVGELASDRGQTFSAKVAGRLRVHVRFDERTALGLVRLRVRYFGDELERLFGKAPS